MILDQHMGYFQEKKVGDLLSYFQPDFGIILMLRKTLMFYINKNNEEPSIFMTAVPVT